MTIYQIASRDTGESHRLTTTGYAPQSTEAVAGHAPFALPLVIEHKSHRLLFVSTIATFNTPVDVTVSEPALETLLSADPETVKYPATLMP